MAKKEAKKTKDNYSFGSIFKESFEEYKKKLSLISKTFLYIYLIPTIILLVILAFTIIIFHPTISGNAIFDSTKGAVGINSEILKDLPIGVIIFVFILALISLIISLMLSLSYIHISLAKNNKTTVSEIWKSTKLTFKKYIGFVLVNAIFLILLYILLIIPGIIFTVYWIFAVFILIAEKKKILPSLKASRNIIRGRWWKTFGYLILLLIIICIISGILSYIKVIGDLITTLLVYSFMIIFMKNFYLKMKK
jgi:hypothetical protein